MGLSFHDELSSVVEGDISRFMADEPNPIPRTGSISHDSNLCIRPHNSNPIPELEIISVREERRDDDTGRSDDIQMVDR